MSRSALRHLLPGDEHANARWMFRLIEEMCEDEATYSCTFRELDRDAQLDVPYPRLRKILDVLQERGLIRYTIQIRRRDKKQKLHITLALPERVLVSASA